MEQKENRIYNLIMQFMNMPIEKYVREDGTYDTLQYVIDEEARETQKESDNGFADDIAEKYNSLVQRIVANISSKLIDLEENIRLLEKKISQTESEGEQEGYQRRKILLQDIHDDFSRRLDFLRPTVSEQETSGSSTARK